MIDVITSVCPGIGVVICVRLLLEKCTGTCVCIGFGGAYKMICGGKRRRYCAYYLMYYVIV